MEGQASCIPSRASMEWQSSGRLAGNEYSVNPTGFNHALSAKKKFVAALARPPSRHYPPLPRRAESPLIQEAFRWRNEGVASIGNSLQTTRAGKMVVAGYKWKFCLHTNRRNPKVIMRDADAPLFQIGSQSPVNLGSARRGGDDGYGGEPGDDARKFPFRVPGAVTAENQFSQNDMANKHVVIFRKDINRPLTACQNVNDCARVQKTRLHSSMRSQLSSMSFRKRSASALLMVPHAARRNAALLPGDFGRLVRLLKSPGVRRGRCSTFSSIVTITTGLKYQRFRMLTTLQHPFCERGDSVTPIQGFGIFL